MDEKSSSTTRYDQNWIAQYFDEYGIKEWQRWEKTPADRVKLHIHIKYLEEFIKPGQRILEIGAGAGRYTQVLAKLGARILVADLSTRQLEINQEQAKKYNYENAIEDWIQLDMCEMPSLLDQDFDCVVCYGGPLSYVFEKRLEAVHEIHRVLKPGGLVLTSVMSLWGTIHENLLGVLIIEPEENEIIIQTGDLHPDTYNDCQHRCHMFTSQELIDLLVGGGFSIMKITSSNTLSAAWGDQLEESLADQKKWSELINLEYQACQASGCLDLGTHIIAVARKSD
jgi:ubiquinone/menaquinone biosynthesis C-methylase UbiE